MALAIKCFYEFGEFRLDTDERVLLKGGKPIAVAPKVFQLLAILVENHGRVVEKNDLMNQVWADSFVEESNLTFTVRQLRKVLGDDAHEPRFIETVPRRGYRFIANVREVLTDDFPGNPNLDVRLKEETKSDTVEDFFIDEMLEEIRDAQPVEEQPQKTKKYVIFGLIGFLAILLLVCGFVIYRSARSELVSPKFQQTNLTRLTSFGNSYLAAISPDGRYVVHVKDEGKQSIWVRQINETRDIEIVPASETKIYGITVSPDSQRLFYTAWDVNKSDYILYQVPILGGTPQKLSDTISSAVTFSPDGEQIAYFFAAASVGNSRLIITKTDGTEQKILAKRKSPETFETDFGSPAWSPDGKSIATVEASMTIGVKSNLTVFNVDDGSEKHLTENLWEEIEHLAWLRDASGLLMIARAESSQPKQIWFVSYPSGEARKITNDLNDYRGLSLTADSKTLVTTRIEQTSRLWVSQNDSIENGKVILSETGTNGAGEGLAWTPEGKIVFRFSENGRDDIWQIGTDGSERKQLTVNSNNAHPTVCGKTIVYSSNQTGIYRLWQMDENGGNPKLLTTNGNDSELYPSCAPDGDWLVYQKGWRKVEIWKVSLKGGEPSPIAETTAIRPAVSPDGKLVAYYYLNNEAWSLAVIPIEGGKPLQKFPLPASVVSRYVRWTPDGKSLAYIDTRNGVSNIWLQSVDGSSPKQLTNFNTEQIFYFDWSRDGKKFAVSRGTITSDVVLIHSVD